MENMAPVEQNSVKTSDKENLALKISAQKPKPETLALKPLQSNQNINNLAPVSGS